MMFVSFFSCKYFSNVEQTKRFACAMDMCATLIMLFLLFVLKVGGPSEPGEFEIWGEWTECSATCGGGRRARERICKINDNAVYVECTGDLLDIENCNTQPCPGLAV